MRLFQRMTAYHRRVISEGLLSDPLYSRVQTAGFLTYECEWQPLPKIRSDMLWPVNRRCAVLVKLGLKQRRVLDNSEGSSHSKFRAVVWGHGERSHYEYIAKLNGYWSHHASSRRWMGQLRGGAFCFQRKIAECVYCCTLIRRSLQRQGVCRGGSPTWRAWHSSEHEFSLSP